MLGKILVSLLGLGFLLLRPAALLGGEPDPSQAVVAVVSLDAQGQPRKQGLGVALGKDGRVLTSASLLAAQGAVVVRTGQGVKYLVQEILYQDALQDLALVKVAADQLPGVDLGAAGRVRPSETVRVGLRQKTGMVLQEIRVARVHPFSPRLTLVKLSPPLAEAEPGAPLFDSRGDLVGLVHTFAGSREGTAGFQVVLTRDRKLLPPEVWPNPAGKGSGEGKERGGAVPPEKKLSSPSGSPPFGSGVGQATGGVPEKPPEKPGAGAYTAFWQGVRASLELKWQEAQERFAAALTVSGDLAEASFGLGVARYHLGNYEGATRAFLEATRHLPNYALATLWLGKAWEKLGNRAAAREAYQRAVKQDAHLHEAWFHLGVLAYQEGNLDQARECLVQAGDELALAAQRSFYLGVIARRRGRLEQAWAAFDEAVRRDAGFLPAYVEGGKTLLDLGRPKEAVQILTELSRRDPKLPLARYHLALAYHAAWNTRGAWEQYLALQQLDPTLASRLAPILEQRR